MYIFFIYDFLNFLPQVEEKKLGTISMSFRTNLGNDFIHGLLHIVNSISDPGKQILVSDLEPKLTGVEFVKHYYCQNCSAILNFNESEDTICRSCHSGQKRTEVVENDCCFISISLKEQLRELVNSHLYPLLSKKHNGSDVTSGTMYQEMVKKMGNEDLSLQWNVSRVKLSVNDPIMSTWLIQVMVNELPYRSRINNVFLCGISHNYFKPSLNAFLHPFISELIDLQENGLTCTTYSNPQPITIKFHTLFCNVETDVRAFILNTAPPYKSYNCFYCLKQDWKVPFSEPDHPRTYDLHMKHCELAVKTGKIVKGVQGPSVVMLHQDINVLQSFPPDYVETCLFSVCKKIVTSWFNVANKKEKFYLGPSKLKLVNEKLKNTKRPCEVTRTPPRQWKLYSASDWRNFVLYYSQHCLEGLLPDNYFKHWMLLVKALHMFSQTTLDEEVFKDACTQFNHFLDLAYQYYQNQINGVHKLHQLKHLPLFIQRYGALWAWSSLPYRRYDGIVQNQFQKAGRENGRDYSPEQLVETFSQLRYLLNNSGAVLTPDSPMLDEFLATMNVCRVKGCFIYGDGIRPLGQPTKIKLQPDEKKRLEKMCGIKPMSEKSEIYVRFAFNDVLFHSYNYEGLKNIDNSVFRTKDRAVLRVVALIKVQDAAEEVAKYVVKAKEIRLLNEHAYWYEGEETENIVYIDYSNIECKCFAINDRKPGILLIIAFPNPFETY